jgi:hypothetical protein
MKATIWIYSQNNGDGSASPVVFGSREAAEAYAEPDDERFGEDIKSVGLEFDEQGKLLTPDPVPEED